MLWQAPHVVVAFDGDGLFALGAATLDHVRVNRALGEEGRAFMTTIARFELCSLLLEHIHKQAANDFSLGFGFTHAGQFAQEQLAGVHADDLGIELANEHLHHQIAFVQAQQAMVHKHAGQLVANGAVDKRCRDRRVNAAGEAQNHFLVTHLFADFGDGIGHVVAHHPVGPGSANVQHKTVQERLALHGVRYLGVKLYAVEMARFVGHAGNGAARRAGHQFEARRQFGNLVAMAHPHLEHAVALSGGEVCNVLEQGGVAMGTHFCVAKLAGVAALHFATKLLRHGLHAVANAQHRHTQGKYRCRRAVGAVFVHAGVAARQNHALERAVCRVGTHPVIAHIAGVHLAVHMGFPHAARNELGYLGAEIEDENFGVLHETP